MHFTPLASLALLTQLALASIYITNPVASTSEKGGATWTIEWQAVSLVSLERRGVPGFGVYGVGGAGGAHWAFRTGRPGECAATLASAPGVEENTVRWVWLGLNADCLSIWWWRWFGGWQDADTATPLASSYGSATVALYTGSATQQLLLQRFDTDIDPSKTTSLKVKVPANIGPDSSN